MVNKRNLILIAALGALLIVGFFFIGGKFGGSKKTVSDQPQSGFSIVLPQLNVSEQNGIVTFEPKEDKTIVKIKTVGYIHGISQPAHIHNGTCENAGDVIFPLNDLGNGESETVLDVSIEEISKSSYILNVHKSNEEINIYTACGIIQAL